ncbi:hypothetical protein [Lysinibacillus varians]|uniref:Phage protein n=1 Tax=Lysinibacillus varians TaxID=1145276 RepID=A0ABY2T7V2_9BACI|nr:hypothetical protein [Lysinibacillus varians]AHN24485.1 hypothetical protein T479_20055 [Lysinibacillus varians]TKI60498.1 hypothetical protein FC752_15025 [Lysinibacillus varians]
MNIEAIHQNAEIISSSVCGRHFNRVVITYDEFAFLTELTGVDNPYKGYGDDFIEMDYHGEFIPLIENAREVAFQREEQKLIEQEEITAWKAVNCLFDDEEENYYHG